MLKKLNLGRVSKAIAGALTSALTTAVSVVDEGINAQEWLYIVLALVVGFTGVYWAPANKTNSNEDTTSYYKPYRNEAGYAAPGFITVLLGLALVLVILWLVGVRVSVG